MTNLVNNKLGKNKWFNNKKNVIIQKYILNIDHIKH